MSNNRFLEYIKRRTDHGIVPAEGAFNDVKGNKSKQSKNMQFGKNNGQKYQNWQNDRDLNVHHAVQPHTQHQNYQERVQQPHKYQQKKRQSSPFLGGFSKSDCRHQNK